jgi:ADP-ribose pyrophosphatase YjhB (NUDIX family)
MKLFSFCPRCGAPDPIFEQDKRVFCPSCNLEYFHNVATAVGALLVSHGRLLLLERAQEPRKGKLALPGGFVDPGERVEDALRRECEEEIGWKTDLPLSFLGSFPNIYRFQGIDYHTCDLFFVIEPVYLEIKDLRLDPQEVAAVHLVPLDQVSLPDLAFESSRRAITLYRER